MVIQEIRERLTLFAQSNEPSSVSNYRGSPIGCNGDEFEEGHLLALINEFHKNLKNICASRVPFQRQNGPQLFFYTYVVKNLSKENS